MGTDEFCIATISLVRNEEEERLLKASLQQLSLLNIPVFVTDGGSPKSFLHFLQRLPNFILLSSGAKGVFAQAKNSLQEAAKTERPFLFYTEPDKLDFFRSALVEMLASISAADNLGVAIASRSAKSFGTFPAFQQMAETTINNCCAEAIGLSADYCYGPFLLNKKLVSFLSTVQEDIGWGWRPFVFNTAQRMGYKVDVVEGDFFCPEDQRDDDAAERVYRMKQLEQNISGLVLSTIAGSKK
jgi:hypothetical protein